MICRHCEEQPINCTCDSAIKEHRKWLAREEVIRKRDVRVPLAVITGAYEKLSAEELNDLIVDLKHEQVKRKGDEFDELCRTEPNPQDRVIFHD